MRESGRQFHSTSSVHRRQPDRSIDASGERAELHRGLKQGTSQALCTAHAQPIARQHVGSTLPLPCRVSVSQSFGIDWSRIPARLAAQSWAHWPPLCRSLSREALLTPSHTSPVAHRPFLRHCARHARSISLTSRQSRCSSLPPLRLPQSSRKEHHCTGTSNPGAVLRTASRTRTVRGRNRGQACFVQEHIRSSNPSTNFWAPRLMKSKQKFLSSLHHRRQRPPPYRDRRCHDSHTIDCRPAANSPPIFNHGYRSHDRGTRIRRVNRSEQPNGYLIYRRWRPPEWQRRVGLRRWRSMKTRTPTRPNPRITTSRPLFFMLSAL